LHITATRKYDTKGEFVMNKNRYSKMKTENLLEFLTTCTVTSWLLFAICMAFLLFADGGILVKVVYVALAISVFPYMKSQKKKVENELANREYTEIDKQNAARKGRKRILIYIGILVVWLSVYSCESSSSSSSRSSSSSSSSETGYWGSDGYYHATESERKQSMKEAQEWMAKNW
jgi:hypothetical protein